MKKILSAILTLVLVLTACAAFAAEIKPLVSVNMEESLDDCMLRVGFKLDSVSEDRIFADIYDEMRYDAVEVTQLAVGDTISFMGEDFTVETIDVDYSTFVNGGYEEGGVTLCPDEGGTYIGLFYETPAYMIVGCAELILADEITYSHWQEAEDGSISDEMIVTVIPAAELKNVLTEEGGDAFYPDSMVVTVEGGKVTAVTVNYVP